MKNTEMEPDATLGELDDLVDFGEGYFKWLEGELLDQDHMSYHSLLRKLHAKEFMWVNEYDENRADDGSRLRARYSEVCGVDYRTSWLTWPCSVLEMVDALAVKIDDMIMYDLSQGERIGEWFWLMLDNLGLLKYSDDIWAKRPETCDRDVDAILRRFMEREWDSHGRPNLFLPKDGKLTFEWSQMDIWGQCVAYFRDVYEDRK